MPILDRINSAFEAWINPFAAKTDLNPPRQGLAFFWHFVRQAKLPFIAMMALSAVVALVEAALFYFVGRLVDLLATAVPADGWSGLVAAHGPELVMMLMVVMVVRFASIWMLAMIEEQTVNYGFFNLVRWQSYVHVSRQSLSSFQEDFAGSIASKVWQSGGALGDFAVSIIQKIWFMVVLTLSSLILVFQLDWRMAGLVAVWIALFVFFAYRFVPRVRDHSSASAERAAAVSGRIVDSYSNIATLKLFGNAESNNHYVRAGFDKYLMALKHLTRTVTTLRAVMALLSGLMIVATAAVGIHLWSQNIITVGAVALTLGLLLRLNAQLDRLLNQLNGVMRNYGIARNAADLISRPILLDAPDAKPLVVTMGEVRFENVNFHYGKPEGIFDNLNLTIAPSERIGLIGRSGAGKSTLVSLLLRFYELADGRITIDGQNIAEVTQESLRGKIGVVTQDTALLHRSVRANLRYGRPDASDEEIIAAAEMASAHEFISELTDHRGRRGYDAQVGERGAKLSGGQRQRVAIGRVLLKNAPILVLDEATSALDSEVEAAIQEQLVSLMRGKTVIAIAHRLSTIAAMDRLIVLDKGAIAEQGTHVELLNREGIYAQLWRHQSGGFLNTEAVA